MPEKPIVMMLDKPHFQVKLHTDTLEVDLKEGARKELERLAEARPLLRDTLGWVFQSIIPLDVKLWQIEKVVADHDGNIHIQIPLRKDLHIPLEPSESSRLVEKLNELIPVEKAKEYERKRAYDEAVKERDEKRTEAMRTPGGVATRRI